MRQTDISIFIDKTNRKRFNVFLVTLSRCSYSFFSDTDYIYCSGGEPKVRYFIAHFQIRKWWINVSQCNVTVNCYIFLTLTFRTRLLITIPKERTGALSSSPGWLRLKALETSASCKTAHLVKVLYFLSERFTNLLCSSHRKQEKSCKKTTNK